MDPCGCSWCSDSGLSVPECERLICRPSDLFTHLVLTIHSAVFHPGLGTDET